MQKQFNCVVGDCLYSVNSPKLFECHEILVHKKAGHIRQCRECGFLFPSKKDLKNHLEFETCDRLAFLRPKNKPAFLRKSTDPVPKKSTDPVPKKSENNVPKTIEVPESYDGFKIETITKTTEEFDFNDETVVLENESSTSFNSDFRARKRNLIKGNGSLSPKNVSEKRSNKRSKKRSKSRSTSREDVKRKSKKGKMKNCNPVVRVAKMRLPRQPPARRCRIRVDPNTLELLSDEDSDGSCDSLFNCVKSNEDDETKIDDESEDSLFKTPCKDQSATINKSHHSLTPEDSKEPPESFLKSLDNSETELSTNLSIDKILSINLMASTPKKSSHKNELKSINDVQKASKNLLDFPEDVSEIEEGEIVEDDEIIEIIDVENGFVQDMSVNEPDIDVDSGLVRTPGWRLKIADESSSDGELSSEDLDDTRSDIIAERHRKFEEKERKARLDFERSRRAKKAWGTKGSIRKLINKIVNYNSIFLLILFYFRNQKTKQQQLEQSEQEAQKTPPNGVDT